MSGERTAVIIDGYLDEPACFGVPPYISPLVRYCAGALREGGADVVYITADQYRATRESSADAIAGADIAVIVSGLSVPGRYRGGSPLTMREMDEIASLPRRGTLILGGPVARGYAIRGGATAKRIVPQGVDLLATGDLDASLDILMRTGEWVPDARRTYADLPSRAVAGASIVPTHPHFPNVIAEIDLSNGCDRTDGRCSFCTEGLAAVYTERAAEDAAEEMAALGRVGVRAFRFGRCANILAYGAEMTPTGARPRASSLRDLYTAAREAVPALRVLHTDNCNPATIARFPDESAEAIAVIAELGTEGDCLSLGVESADPAVIASNRLKTDAEGSFTAVRVINEAGGARRRPRGLPAVLPGLNFLFGLDGETKETAEHDRRFLERLLDAGLAVRRINIRRAMIFDETELSRRAEAGSLRSRMRERDIAKWRDWVRSAVDTEMMRRVAPDGTIIRDVLIEERAGGVAFGRPLGSYPPLVGVVSPDAVPGEMMDAAVTGRGPRSLTAVRSPLDIMTASRSELEALPEIGRARAEAIISMRARETDKKKILEALDAPGISERLMKWSDHS